MGQECWQFHHSEVRRQPSSSHHLFKEQSGKLFLNNPDSNFLNLQVQAQQVTCAALYANCSVLRWDDPLECSYCSFSNSSGYVTQLTGEQNRTCAQADGQVILGQCPPVIYKVTIGGNDVTVVGDHLTSFRDPKVFVCDTECEDAHFQTNA